jgi:hypothetical protein
MRVGKPKSDRAGGLRMKQVSNNEADQISKKIKKKNKK